MAWRFTGRAQVNSSSPAAFAVCDRCSMWYNHRDLNWQYQYAGPKLQNLRLLVCRTCLDTPQPQLKPRILSPDPVPIMNARPENFLIDDASWVVAQDGDYLVTQDSERIVIENSSNQRLPPD